MQPSIGTYFWCLEKVKYQSPVWLNSKHKPHKSHETKPTGGKEVRLQQVCGPRPHWEGRRQQEQIRRANWMDCSGFDPEVAMPTAPSGFNLEWPSQSVKMLWIQSRILKWSSPGNNNQNEWMCDTYTIKKKICNIGAGNIKNACQNCVNQIFCERPHTN